MLAAAPCCLARIAASASARRASPVTAHTTSTHTAQQWLERHTTCGARSMLAIILHVSRGSRVRDPGCSPSAASPALTFHQPLLQDRAPVRVCQRVDERDLVHLARLVARLGLDAAQVCSTQQLTALVFVGAHGTAAAAAAAAVAVFALLAAAHMARWTRQTRGFACCAGHMPTTQTGAITRLTPHPHFLTRPAATRRCCLVSCSCSRASRCSARRSRTRSARAWRSSAAAFVWLGLLRSLLHEMPGSGMRLCWCAR
jgi:hypothetical protein